MSDIKLCYAWDTPIPEGTALPDEIERAMSLSDRVKIGAVVWTAMGRSALRIVQGHLHMPVFLDLKFHDIPNTVHDAVKAACDHGVSMLNVHASGGRAMMEAAAKAASEYDTKVIAVTVLTSMDINLLHDLGLLLGQGIEHDAIPTVVARMGLVAYDSGLDGVVCSAREARSIRHEQHEPWSPPGWAEADFDIVCPAIRPTWAVAKDDQKRPTTPTDAVNAGATEIVVGRPIAQPPLDPLSGQQITQENAVLRIRAELEQAQRLLVDEADSDA